MQLRQIELARLLTRRAVGESAARAVRVHDSQEDLRKGVQPLTIYLSDVLARTIGHLRARELVRH